MKVYTEILGNISDPAWCERASTSRIEYIDLDQWTAQKSRFVARGDRGGEYAVALRRHSSLAARAIQRIYLQIALIAVSNIFHP